MHESKEVHEQVKDAHWNLQNHKPTVIGIEKIEKIRNYAQMFAEQVAMLCPDSREKSLAQTNIEQATMWAVASIARTDTEDER
jgi:hypothetical protein